MLAYVGCAQSIQNLREVLRAPNALLLFPPSTPSTIISPINNTHGSKLITTDSGTIPPEAAVAAGVVVTMVCRVMKKYFIVMAS